MSAQDNLSPGQFYHGTRARLSPGDFIKPGYAPSSYNGGEPIPYTFATTDRHEADRWGRSSEHNRQNLPRTYVVEPVDPSTVIPDRGARASFMSSGPLKVVQRVPWGVGLKMHQDDIRNAGTSRQTELPAVEKRFRARNK